MTDAAGSARPAQYEVEFVRDVRIPTAVAGVSLGADLHLPAGAGPVPLLLLALPYRKDAGGADLLHRYFARRGYACMTLDLMGTGTSDGVPRAPFDAADADDAVAAINWAAEQPWCDGNVGMWGHSYGGMTTLRAASRRPAPLKAIIPVQGLVDPERDFAHPDHARGSFGPHTWISGMLGNLLMPPLHAPDDADALARWRARLDRADDHVLDLFRLPPGDPRWRARVVDTSAIEVPALCFLGWRDLFADPMARAFEALTGPKRLIAGPWQHVIPVVTEQGSLDWFGICLDWWDRWLLGVQNGADAEPSAFFVQGPEPYWTALEAWPPRGEVKGAVEAETTKDLLFRPTSAPTASDPTVGTGSGFSRLAVAGVGLPADSHDDDFRSACWTSEPLEQPLAVIGRPEVVLEAPAAGRVVARLTHVDPAGRSVFITSGALGEAHPDRTDRVLLDSTAYRVPVGHRLRVVLSDADFPRLWPLPAGSAPSPRLRAVTLPVPLPSELRDVRLPGQPEYLTALMTTLQAGGGGTTWVLERELLTDALTLTNSSTVPGAATDGPGAHIASASTTRTTVSATGAAEITVDSSWRLTWPDHPVVAVEVTTRGTEGGFEARGRVTTGDTLTFDKTWTTTATETGDARA